MLVSDISMVDLFSTTRSSTFDWLSSRRKSKPFVHCSTGHLVNMYCMTESMSYVMLYLLMHDRIYGLCVGHALSADAMHDRLCAAGFAGHAGCSGAMHERIHGV